MTTPQNRQDRLDHLARLLRGSVDAEVTAFYDTLSGAGLSDMLGAWAGAEIPTGHPLGGLLGAYGWHGKRFEDVEHVHPLVFEDDHGHFSVDPTLLPVSGLPRLARLSRTRPVQAAGRRGLRLLRTTRPQARLRLVEHRGVLGAAMIYDRLPIVDHFRRVDADTLVGAMDLRGVEPLFYFALRRENPRSTDRTARQAEN